MKKNILILIALSLALSLGFSACVFSLAQDVTPPAGYQPPVYEEPEVLTGSFPEMAPNPAAGAEIYAVKCLACHGEAGLGDGPDSTGLPVEVARIGSAQLVNTAAPLQWFSITTQGNIEQFMPPFSGSLDDQDVWDVLSYVYTFGDAPEKTAAGEQVFADTCAACHGTDGAGSAPGAANLTDAEQMVTLSISDIMQQVATGNGNQDHVFSTVLDETQIEDVAYYVRSLVFPLEGEQIAAATATPEPTAAPTEAVAADEDAAADAGQDEAAPTGQAGDEEIMTIGRVTGMVISGSGGDIPEGLEVTLEVYQHFDQILDISAPVEADGSFAFDDVPIEPEQIYLAVIEKDGLFFPSEFYIAEDGDTEIDLPVTIYETSTSTENLVISRLHVFFQFTGEGTVQVIHQVSISNRGSELVAPDESNTPVLNFSLPEGAQNLIFQSGAIGSPYVETADGFGDPSAVLPGESSYEILFAYELPYERSLDWQLPADLPMDVAVIFVQGEQAKLDSNTLMPSGTEALETEIFQVLVANAVPEGGALDLSISGKVFGTAASGETNWLVIGAGVVGVLLAGYGAWQFFRPVDDEDWDDDEEDDAAALESERLMDEIIALDDTYAAGDLTEDAYQAERNKLKTALKNALEQEGSR